MHASHPMTRDPRMPTTILTSMAHGVGADLGGFAVLDHQIEHVLHIPFRRNELNLILTYADCSK